MRIVLAVIAVVLLACSTNRPETVAAPEAQRSSTGDTVVAFIHRVLPQQRAQYDSLMRTVWWPAAQRATQKYPEFGRALRERHRYVPIEAGDDSTLTYIHLYTLPIGLPEGQSALQASGMPEAEIEEFGSAQRAVTTERIESIMVEQEYR